MAEAQYDTHVVIADFDGTAENELTINVGEKLLVLQTTSAGWSEGYTSDQRQGWYPSAYAKLDVMGRSDVMAEIKEANRVSEESQNNPSSQDSSSNNQQPMSVQTAAKRNKALSKPDRSKKKKEEKPVDNPFPGIRHHQTAAGGDSPFPGIRHHQNPAPFPGIRHHTPAVDEKTDKKKKAEEKKKAKEQRKKDKELKKDLRMAATGLFGVPLKAAVAQEQHETSIPFIVRACVEHILKGKNLLREGLFRISGVKTEIDSLKSCFEGGVEGACWEALEKADIDAVAGVLKLYLRELPDPLFTYKHHSKFVKAGCEKNLGVIKATLGMLPPGHKETLLFILGFLCKVAEYQEVNMMRETNIGIVFAPTIMKCPSDDENDDPEALKEAFFYVLHQSAGLLKDEPRIDQLLSKYYEANTCSGDSVDSEPSSSSSLPPPPLANSGGPSEPADSSPGFSSVVGLPPPTLSSGASDPSVTPPPIGSLPPPISN